MKKLLAFLITIVILVSLLCVPAFAESVAVTPEIAVKCYEDSISSLKAPNHFNNFKGYFYIDLNGDNIPELAMVYSDSSNWDSCAVFYFCKLSFDFTNGLMNSTPVYSPIMICELPGSGWGEHMLSTSIGGSGGTDAGIYRLDNGSYGVGTDFHSSGISEETIYTYSGLEFFEKYYGGGEMIWSVRGQVPGKFDYYTMPDPDKPFSDVSKTDYFYDAVKWAIDNEITAGTSATTFTPEGTCTRGQVVTFLYRLSGSPNVKGTNPFSDVSVGDYYYNAVLWAVEKGITAGTSATTFSPDATCTGGQVITFLHRAKGLPLATNPGNVYEGKYYKDAVCWASENGIFDVLPGSFYPEKEATRGEIVTYMYKDSFVKTELPEPEHSFEDKTYSVKLEKKDVVLKNGVQYINARLIEYVGLSEEEVENLAKGQKFNFSKVYEEAPDIVVETWDISDTKLTVNGKYIFYFDSSKGRYIYDDMELSPNGTGLYYFTGEEALIPVSHDVSVTDFSTAYEIQFDSVDKFFASKQFEQSYFANLTVKDGYVAHILIEFRP